MPLYLTNWAYVRRLLHNNRIKLKTFTVCGMVKTEPVVSCLGLIRNKTLFKFWMITIDVEITAKVMLFFSRLRL